MNDLLLKHKYISYVYSMYVTYTIYTNQNIFLTQVIDSFFFYYYNFIGLFIHL